MRSSRCGAVHKFDTDLTKRWRKLYYGLQQLRVAQTARTQSTLTPFLRPRVFIREVFQRCASRDHAPSSSQASLSPLSVYLLLFQYIHAAHPFCVRTRSPSRRHAFACFWPPARPLGLGPRARGWETKQQNNPSVVIWKGSADNYLKQWKCQNCIVNLNIGARAGSIRWLWVQKIKSCFPNSADILLDMQYICFLSRSLIGSANQGFYNAYFRSCDRW